MELVEIFSGLYEFVRWALNWNAAFPFAAERVRASMRDALRGCEQIGGKCRQRSNIVVLIKRVPFVFEK